MLARTTRRSVLLTGLGSAGMLACRPFLGTAAAQGRSFADEDLTRKNLADQILDGADFTGATLRGTQLDRASLRGAVFKNADLRLASLQKADLTGADLRDCVFNPHTGETNFSRANFEGLDMQKNSFSYDNCQGANFRNTTNWGSALLTNFRGADFRGANLVGMPSFSTLNDRAFGGAIYDDRTRFPSWLDPERMGARRAGA